MIALPPLSRHSVVLFIPETTIQQKTATLFAALDHLPFDPGGLAESFGRREPRSFPIEDVFNAFERVSFDAFEGLRELRGELQRRCGLPVRLAGAGPTLFWIGDGADARAVASAGSGLPCTVVVTDTASRR